MSAFPVRLLRDRRIRISLIVAAVVAAYLVLREALPEVELQELLEDVSTTLGSWTYVLVGVFAFLETGAFVGFVAPGETVVILGGAVAGQGATSVYVTIAVVWFCAWAGDSVSFLLGRRLGREFVLRHGERVRITPERFAQVERYFRRHGGKTILIGRFIGLVRALAPFVAGSSGMRYSQFVPFSILGTGLWSAVFTVIGYFASRSIDTAAEVAGTGTALFATAVVTVVVIVWVVRFLRVPENRVRTVEAMERSALLRPILRLGRVVRPQARFLWHRITPGGLGLEFTTIVAVLAVSLYVLIAYAATLGGDPGTTGADRAAADIVVDLRTPWLTDVAEVVTELGSLYALFAVTVIAAGLLAGARRWAELAVLVGATVIMVVGVPELKDAVDRPRPAGGLVDVEGSGFPSGHATYSAIYTWLAITFALRFGIRGGTPLVIVGIALTAAIGLTRVYLGVHYLSDVIGGWALGASAFSTCAAVAVVVTHFRQNSRRDGRRRDPV
jgi:membrane protein DedA with SNARE-associated domain/membrane-associated phospholipid phosphatase